MGKKGFYTMFRTKEEFEAVVYQTAEKIVQSITIQTEFKAQAFLDAFTIVLHQEYGFGASRMKVVLQKVQETMQEIFDMMREEAEASNLKSKDKEAEERFTFSKKKIDDAICDAVGKENFAPWDKRYKKLYRQRLIIMEDGQSQSAEENITSILTEKPQII